MQNHSPIIFPTDYNEVLERINTIHPIKYAQSRNFLNGHVTYLSPYISRGVISVKQVMDSLVSKGYPFQAIEKLIQELAWREYFQRVWQDKKEMIWEDLKQTQPNVLHHQMISSILNATTGIDIIDQQIINLSNKGYLHNHIRMYIASIVCNIGNAHWASASKWMYYHLLDGDIASNNCSWQWVAGAFSSKKYYCNQENINKYTFSKQTDSFLDKPYEALLNATLPPSLKETVSLQLITHLPKTDPLQLDPSIPTLIYNAYNLDPLWRKNENVNRVLILEPSHFNKYPVSEKVIEFIIALSKNIAGLKLYVGEVTTLINLIPAAVSSQNENFISKEHPLFDYYPGIKDDRDWMFPTVTGYYPSFFSYWKKCERALKHLR
jgi:deoxyribodipyrimidine photo-lyase